MPAAPTLFISLQNHLFVRRWGEELVVFDQRSGDTHLLTGLASRLVLQLQAGDPTDSRMPLEGARAPDEPPFNDAELERTVAELERLGIVQRIVG